VTPLTATIHTVIKQFVQRSDPETAPTVFGWRSASAQRLSLN